MAIGPSTYLIDAWMNALGNGVAYDNDLGVFIKLHIGDPGASGTSNAATETTRKSASFASSATVTGGRGLTTDAEIRWAGIGSSQDATHFSAWDDLTAGNFLGSGTITAAAYTSGDDYVCPAGSLNIALTPAS